ncbi:hypothetical protein VTH8203_01084 [Vibrio thalassae]|uniref:DUF3135 domain-containing protein n=1 Tax=Vibrio thalassae TaxID=1243014 RepID=A0A240EHR5_9VIBR|nr:DUF3135 domain-containing protein [Vibrio thalassae]SNX47480.1 hypothetical protein VTH8203_01084 [Vibrio thalassae]
MDPSIRLPSFDELVAMAKHNPEQLSQLRHDLTEQFIASCSTDMQPRLHAQQSHIERILQHAKNPIHANILLRQELHRQIIKFSQALNGNAPSVENGAEIVPFSKSDDWR